MSLQHIERVEQRVRGYWYQDGLAELATGAVFVLLGVYFGLQGYFGEGSTRTVILQLSMVLLMVLGAYFVRRIVGSLKMRLTYPRTGYVEYHADAGNVRLRRFAAAGVGLLVAMLLVYLVRYVRGLELVVLATGVLVAFILVALSVKARGMKRFYVLGALSLALGILLSLSGLPQAYGLASFYGLLGIILMISGGWVLRRYLHENPLRSEA